MDLAAGLDGTGCDLSSVVSFPPCRIFTSPRMTGDSTATVATAKSFDTFKPLGPCLVAADEFGEPLDLRIRARVNNELRQDDRTCNFIHWISDLIAYLSRYYVLQAGDVICTGTGRRLPTRRPR
jgi:2-keto-4-pentenoate hydratase/2-oxohepta-3-ene-1,7-dioic acid hydratase in catechol pathway